MVDSGLKGMHLFEIAWLGIPYSIIGLAYILLTGWMLPNRKELLEQLGETRRE
jgi:di/tricarboxylate transporter